MRGPLPRSPRVPCDPPGCGSGVVVAPPRLPGLLSYRSSAEGWELALLPGTVLCRTVRTALDLIVHLGYAPIAQTPFHCSAAPCWQPRRVDAGMQKGTKRPIFPPIRGVSSLLVPCSFTAYLISVPCRSSQSFRFIRSSRSCCGANGRNNPLSRRSALRMIHPKNDPP